MNWRRVRGFLSLAITLFIRRCATIRINENKNWKIMYFCVLSCLGCSHIRQFSSSTEQCFSFRVCCWFVRIWYDAHFDLFSFLFANWIFHWKTQFLFYIYLLIYCCLFWFFMRMMKCEHAIAIHCWCRCWLWRNNGFNVFLFFPVWNRNTSFLFRIFIFIFQNSISMEKYNS